MKRIFGVLIALCALVCGVAGQATAQKGFVQLFDGKTLTGWKLVGGFGPGYVPKDGILVCPADGGGNLFTEKEYSDFVFKFDFQLEHAANNGIGIRAPYQGDAAYMGMECQVLDDSDPMYAHLEPGQYHSSVYKVIPAKRGSEKPVGQWNHEEITAIGRHIKIVVNGMVTVDGSLNDVTNPETLAQHPGMLRATGHVGFLGHGPSGCAFRNIYIKDLSKPEKENKAPDGFITLFDGKDLKGWKGLVGNPVSRAKMTQEQLAEAQKKADAAAFQHWTVVNGVITYDGKNDNLCTAKDYGDFEMLVDWKITPSGDSGIYLRGSPQVQIWDPEHHPNRNPQEMGEGSGGLYNNEKNTTHPSHLADKPVGEWNRFRILMVGDHVTVYLNNELVVQNVQMENYWERGKPIYPTGQIELQHHTTPLEFKNIYIREIPRK
jgi:hypothetical protein